MSKAEVIQYKTEGTCCQMMQVAIQDDKVLDADFYGGCNGNLEGIRCLIKGMSVDEIIDRLGGIKCGPKPTSCPDQLARCLIEYKQKQMAANKQAVQVQVHTKQLIEEVNPMFIIYV